MKGILVYDTSYGNARTTAETISETLNKSGIKVDIFICEGYKEAKLKGLRFPGSGFSNYAPHNKSLIVAILDSIYYVWQNHLKERSTL